MEFHHPRFLIDDFAQFVDILSIDQINDNKTLNQKADIINNYFGLKIISKLKNKQIKIIEKVKHEVLQAWLSIRTTSLLRLKMMENFDFFDTVTPSDIFDNAVQTNPVQLLNHLPPGIGQSFQSLITEIFFHIEEFADAFINTYSNDISNIEIFSYSTFPSLFGYFTFETYSEKAGEFLIHLLNKISDNKYKFNIIHPIFVSYFITQPQFFNHLWSNVEANLKLFGNQQDSEALIANDFFNIFYQSLQISIPYLTNKHFDVLSIYYKNNKNKIMHILFEDVFYMTFRERNMLKDNNSKEKVLLFSQYLKSLADINMDDKAFLIHRKNIIKLLIKSSNCRLDIVSKTAVNKINFLFCVMSDRDICTLIDIYEPKNSKELFKRLKDSKSQIFKNKYTPFLFHIHFFQNSESTIENFHENETYDRLYNKILEEARNKSQNLLSLIRGICKKLDSNHGEKFENYALKKYILTFKDQLKSNEECIDLNLDLNRISLYKRCVDENKKYIMLWFIEKYKKEMLINDVKFIERFTEYSKISRYVYICNNIDIPNFNEKYGNFKQFKNDFKNKFLVKAHNWKSKNQKLASYLMINFQFISLSKKYGYVLDNLCTNLTYTRDFIQKYYLSKSIEGRFNICIEMFGFILSQYQSENIYISILYLHFLLYENQIKTIPLSNYDIVKLNSLYQVLFRVFQKSDVHLESIFDKIYIQDTKVPQEALFNLNRIQNKSISRIFV